MSDMSKLRELKIDSTKIDEELAVQAANFLFVAEKSVEAEARYLSAKMNHEVLCAKLDGELRDSFERRGMKTTEKAIESAMLLNEKYQESRKSLNLLACQRDAVRALKEAWYMRKDLLIRMAINQRAEIEGLNSEVVKAA